MSHHHNHGSIVLDDTHRSVQLVGNHITVTESSVGDDTVTGSHTNHDTIILGDGNDTITITGNHDTIILGNGVDKVIVKGNHDTVIVGSGNGDNVMVSGNHDKVAVGNGPGDIVLLGPHSVHDHVSVVGTGGTDTITTVAGDNHNSFDLGASDSSLTLHGNHNFVFVDGGTETITDSIGGKDHLKLEVGALGGTIDITNFSAAHGIVGLDPSLGLPPFTSGADAAADLKSDGSGGSLLPFTGTLGSIDFLGVAPSALDAGNFFLI